MSTLQVVLHGMFAFHQTADQIIIRLPYHGGHRGRILVPFLPPIELSKDQPPSFTFQGLSGSGKKSLVDPHESVLCMEYFQMDDKAQRFAQFTIPRPNEITLLSGTPMCNPFTLPDTKGVKNPGMKQFADQFLLSFDCSIPYLVPYNQNPIPLADFSLTINSGPDSHLGSGHRQMAAKACAKHFVGLNLDWDGLLPPNCGEEARPGILLIDPPGCSPSFGTEP